MNSSMPEQRNFQSSEKVNLRSNKRHAKGEEESNEVSPKRLSPNTPSRFLARLNLNANKQDTESPENNVTTPRKLFETKTPKIKLAYSALSNVPTVGLLGREKETDILKNFICDHCDRKKAGSIYISGPPGSGKTATLNNILSDSKVTKNMKIAYMNCTSLGTTNLLFARILEELKLDIKVSGKKYVEAISECLVTSKTMILLVLDEIDQLENRKQSILYTVFEWCSLKNSKLILVGIANALDLTDRTLPRLQGAVTTKPTLLHFPSYTKQQLVDIILHRLKKAEADSLFPENAINLLAAKVAAVSGDARRTLDIARRVISVAESKTDGGGELRIQLTDVLHVINNVYGTSSILSNHNQIDQSDSEKGDNAFPLHQKLIICSLLLLMKTPKLSKDRITIGKLHDTYKGICQKRNLSVLDISEFLSVCSLIEGRGILSVKGKTRSRQSKVSLQWDQQEITMELQDKTLLADILNNDSFFK